VVAASALAVAAAIGAGPAASPAGASTSTYISELSSTDPTMEVVSIDGTADTCIGMGGQPVHYDVYPVRAGSNGHLTLTLSSLPDSFASLYLYQGSFDPANGLQHCIAGDNSNDTTTEKIIDHVVTLGTQYYVVVFDDTFAQSGGFYKLVVNAPPSLLGTATSAPTGTGKKYVKMPTSIHCSTATANAIFKAKAKKVKKAIFKAVSPAGVTRVAKVLYPKPGHTVVLKHIPASSTRLIGVMKLKAGGKAKVRQSYVIC
jgi:hypothetical protein